jgi:hypothetical protein
MSSPLAQAMIDASHAVLTQLIDVAVKEGKLERMRSQEGTSASTIFTAASDYRESENELNRRIVKCKDLVKQINGV